MRRTYDVKCSVTICQRQHFRHGFCNGHYSRWRRLGDPVSDVPFKRHIKHDGCNVPECHRKHKSNGFCAMHYARFRRCGHTYALRSMGLLRGNLCHKWRGGIQKRCDGYVLVMANYHPAVSKNGTVFQHRLVMEKHLGRFLRPEEVVHHKLKCEGGTGRKDDNSIENLILFANQQKHASHHNKLYKLYGKNAR